MRLNYYQFPEDGSVDAHTRYLEGCEAFTGEGDRETGRCTEAGYLVSGVSISAAKRLLKTYGGSAWTDHCERNGGVFEVTPIEIKGNNSSFKYNHHL